MGAMGLRYKRGRFMKYGQPNDPVARFSHAENYRALILENQLYVLVMPSKRDM